MGHTLVGVSVVLKVIDCNSFGAPQRRHACRLQNFQIHRASNERSLPVPVEWVSKDRLEHLSMSCSLPSPFRRRCYCDMEYASAAEMSKLERPCCIGPRNLLVTRDFALLSKNMSISHRYHENQHVPCQVGKSCVALGKGYGFGIWSHGIATLFVSVFVGREETESGCDGL